MIRADEIAAYMGRRRKSAAQVAREIGMNPATFKRKMVTGKFLLPEVETIIKALDIPSEDVMPIFFDQ